MAGQQGNGAAFDAVQPRDRAIARRTFLGLGGAAALSLLLAPRLAWGGVGGGSWGSAGATAHPGSHFGYDGRVVEAQVAIPVVSQPIRTIQTRMWLLPTCHKW